MRLERYEETVADFSAIIELKPEKAVRDYGEVLRLRPDDGSAVAELRKAAEETGGS